MKKLASSFKNSKLYAFLKRAHIFYLFLAIMLYMVKLLMYNISASINPNGHIWNMTIDNKIPFIKYFVIFYYTYYFLPIVLLWLVSFKDKKKFYICLSSIFVCCFISNLIYSIYNVKSVRPDYINPNMTLKDITSFDMIFDFMVAKIYKIDPTGLNCFPSIHASLGVFMVILSISKDKERRISKIISLIGIICGVLCAISTVFIKQHYLVDTIAGVGLAIICYILITLLYNKKSSTK